MELARKESVFQRTGAVIVRNKFIFIQQARSPDIIPDDHYLF